MTAFDDENKIIRYNRKKYDINIESLINEDYGGNKNKGTCGCKTLYQDDHEMFVPEGDEIEAVQHHLRERITIQNQAIKNWVKLGLRL